MEFQEYKGKSVEEAVTAACEQLLVPSEKLEYEIIENGSAGFLGIGAKDAVIKARIKEEEDVKEAVSEKTEAVKSESVKKEKTNKKSEKKNEKKATPAAPEKVKERDLSNIDPEKVKADAEKFLNDVIKAMDMSVKVNLEYFANEGELYVELSGEEMGVLIGKRGMTLDSLQYLTSLVVNKNTDAYVRVKVDTEDYRRRRKDTLENLARNMASKAKKTRRSVSLEPMNPYERRIIHSALQSDKYVTTHSEGNEPYRRVVINPGR